ncbi:MAG: DUF2877 domain-containing protein [Kiritimatiellia bacterium]
MNALSIGDRVRPGTYAVRARFARSALLLGEADRALFVVDPTIGAGPLNLVVDAPRVAAAGESLAIPRRGNAPRFDSAMPRLLRAERAKLLRVLESTLPRHAPAESLVSLFFPGQRLARLQQARNALFQAAFAHFASGRLKAGVRLIRGCGEGLTPSGDDFLCGWMLACRLRGNPALAKSILKHALGRNPVSNAFLSVSAQGRVNVAVQRLLESPASARVQAVCAFGHSSGADLLCGLRYGLVAPRLRRSETVHGNRWPS